MHSEVAAAVRAAEAELGPVDVLVNNAGIEGEGGFFANTQPEQWGPVRASLRDRGALGVRGGLGIM